MSFTISGHVVQKMGDGMPQVIPHGQKTAPASKQKQQLIGNVTVGLFPGKIEDSKFSDVQPIQRISNFDALLGYKFNVKEPGWYTVLLQYEGTWQRRRWETEREWSWWPPGYAEKWYLCPFVWLSADQQHVSGIDLYETTRWTS